MEKYAFKMMLNPGCSEEYRKRHDEIWPELIILLKDTFGTISTDQAHTGFDYYPQQYIIHTILLQIQQVISVFAAIANNYDVYHAAANDLSIRVTR